MRFALIVSLMVLAGCSRGAPAAVSCDTATGVGGCGPDSGVDSLADSGDDGGTRADSGVDSGIGDSNVPPWVNSPTAWDPLPEAGHIWTSSCLLQTGRAAEIQIPPLQWEICGPACERAPLHQGIGNWVSPHAMQAHKFGTDTRVYLNVYNGGIPWGNQGGVSIGRHIDLLSGESVGEIRVQVRAKDGVQLVACNTGYSTDRQAFGIGYWIASGTAQQDVVVGGLRPAERTWWWLLPWRPFDDTIDATGGSGNTYLLLDSMQLVIASARKLWVTPDPGSSTVASLEVLDQHVLTSAATDGESVVWAEVESAQVGSRIRQWRPGQPSASILMTDSGVDSCEVALGGGTVATWSVAPVGPRSCGDLMSGGRLRVIRDDNFASVSPSLTNRNSAVGLAAWGQYVAAIIHPSYNSMDDFVLLTRSSDWSARRIVAPAPRSAPYEIALSDKFLFLVFHSYSDYGHTDAVYRYDLGSFASIGAPFDWAQ